MVVTYRRRPPLGEEELQRLFAAAWGSAKPPYQPVLRRSFTWIAARSPDDVLVGFVNVAWDGGVHFFLLDTTVHPGWQGRGIGRVLVSEATDACRGRGQWMHVDADEALMSGFYGRCGFRATPAGLVNLE